MSAKHLSALLSLSILPNLFHRRYICICASHVFIGLPIVVLRPAVHARARFNQRFHLNTFKCDAANPSRRKGFVGVTAIGDFRVVPEPERTSNVDKKTLETNTMLGVCDSQFLTRRVSVL